MTPDKDMGMWTGGLALIGGIVANIDTGVRTMLLAGAAALIGILIGLGYNSMMASQADIKTEFRAGLHALKADACANYDKVDNRLRGLEAGQSEVKTLVQTHLSESRGATVDKQVK